MPITMNTPRLTLDQLREKLNKPQRKPQGHEESDIQQACIRWFDLVHPNKMLFAIPNGGKRGKREAGILKAEGVRAGVADLFLMQGNGYANGLFIEMKTDTGKQSEAQKAFEQLCFVQNYKYFICRSFDDFQKVITDYLNR